MMLKRRTLVAFEESDTSTGSDVKRQKKFAVGSNVSYSYLELKSHSSQWTALLLTMISPNELHIILTKSQICSFSSFLAVLSF